MSLAIAVLNIGFLVFISHRVWRKDQSQLRKFFWPALILKLIAGILLGLVYAYYYTVGDTFNYFDDGVKLADVARSDFKSYLSFLWSGDDSFPVWSDLVYKQPRAMFLSKITSVFCILTGNNYWIISLYFSTITFFSTWIFSKKIATLYSHTKSAVVVGFLFFPSVVFWSAGIIKESLAMAALYFLCFLFLKIWEREFLKPSEWLLALVSIWVLWNLKYYYVAIFFPIVVTSLALRFILTRVRVSGLTGKILLWCSLFFVPLVLVTVLHPNFYPQRFLEVVVSSYYQYQAISDPEDLIHYHSLRATPVSVLQNMPLALFSGFFRPFLTEATTILQLLIALENLLLLVLSASAFTQVKKLMNSRHRLLLFSIVMYAIFLCVFLALSTPNFGTLSRYRVGFLPFLVLLITLENPLIHKLMALKWMKNLVP